jgi:hypothetical protein
VQDDVAIARGDRYRDMIERIGFDRLGAGRDAIGGARPHQAHDVPAGLAKGQRRRMAEPAGRTQHQNARGHAYR